MVMHFRVLLILMAIIFGAHGTGFCGSREGNGAEDTFQKVNYFIDFSDYESGSVDNWLRQKGFKFERDEVPVISGVALAIDTSKSGNDGKAAAIIKSIEFLE